MGRYGQYLLTVETKSLDDLVSTVDDLDSSLNRFTSHIPTCTLDKGMHKEKSQLTLQRRVRYLGPSMRILPYRQQRYV